MIDKALYPLRDAISKVVAAGFSETAMKKAQKQIRDLMCDLQTNLEYTIIEDAQSNIASHVQEMAQDAVLALLDGNEDRMRSYLSADPNGWTGRDKKHVSVIHGKLFETSAIELRKKIVEAHADLIKNERILDLEAQVGALVEKVNELETYNYRLTERLNEV